jgi:DNA cross-link repair 1C protein
MQYRHPGRRARFAISCAVPNQLVGPGPSMPRETPFHGLIPPFPIRVDQFGASPGLTAIPALYLLSHTHSDHILGLSAKSFASTIICSPDAKQMLLKHELYRERFLMDVDFRDEARLSRTFAHLKVPPFLKDGKLDFSLRQDLLVCYPYT